jgi:outer membrane receptor for ferrienterochelin and colicins
MKAFDFQFGFTMQRSLYDEELPWGEDELNTTQNFIRTPNNYGYLTTNWKPLKGFSASLTGTFTGSMLVPHIGLDPNTNDQSEMEAILKGDVITGEELVVSKPFFDMGIRFAYLIKLNKKLSIELHGGVKNIFNSIQQDLDSGMYRDPGFVYGPNYARTVYFGLKFGNLL